MAHSHWYANRVSHGGGNLSSLNTDFGHLALRFKYGNSLLSVSVKSVSQDEAVVSPRPTLGYFENNLTVEILGYTLITRICGALSQQRES